MAMGQRLVHPNRGPRAAAAAAGLMPSQGNAGPSQVSLTPRGGPSPDESPSTADGDSPGEGHRACKPDGGLGAARPWGRTQEDAGPPQVFLTPSGGGLGAARPWGHTQAGQRALPLHRPVPARGPVRPLLRMWPVCAALAGLPVAAQMPSAAAPAAAASAASATNATNASAAGLVAAAAPGATPASGAMLPKLVVSATRSAASQDEVAATVDAQTAQDVQRKQATDLKDLLRDQPGLSVRAQPNRSSAAFYSTGRGGNEGINIRGLEGNHVMLQTDGVRLPMIYASGPFFAGRADTLDLAAYKQVEILRGPSSTAYGSDGLAGAVSFVTKDPSDLLTLGRPTQTALELGYAGADRSWSLVPSWAMQGEGVQAMLLAALRRGHETESMGDRHTPDRTRTVPNPQQRRSGYLLGKLVLQPDARQRIELAAEHLERRIETDIYTLFGDPMYPTTTEVFAREEIGRSLLKAEYSRQEPGGRWFQKMDASLYWQDSENAQHGFEARSNTSGWNTRTRDTRYGETTLGASLQFETLVGDLQQLVWGLDLSRADIHSLKDGANLLDGVDAGSFQRSRSFPNTDYTLAGAFVQDTLDLGALKLTPGLRLDGFRLQPRRNDPLYSNSQPPVTLKGHELSPKLGAVWQLTPALSAVAQYAHGFRAPAPPQVNGGVTNLGASIPYRAIGNPDLKPETSDSIELGLRGGSPSLRWMFTVFRSRYDNFIAEGVDVTDTTSIPLEPDMPANTRTFQSINLRDVTISGAEASLSWMFAPGWQARAAWAHARGDQSEGGDRQPLQTVDPDKLVLALRHDAAAWGAEASARLVDRKRRNPDADGYTPPGYGVLDLAAWWQVDRHLRLNLALANALDKKYTEWADVRELAATSTLVDAYTQPGRSLSLSLQVQY